MAKKLTAAIAMVELCVKRGLSPSDGSVSSTMDRMKRRSFLVTGATALTVTPDATSAKPKKNLLMHVGGDYHSVAGPGITSTENLDFNLRYGVKHLTVQLSGILNLDELMRMREACEARGVTLEAIRMDSEYITLPKGADRARALEMILGNIEKAGKAGVKVLTYHWTVIPIRRNRQTAGRGNHVCRFQAGGGLAATACRQIGARNGR